LRFYDDLPALNFDFKRLFLEYYQEEVAKLNRIDQLRQEIQLLRAHLVELAREREFSDPEVLGASKILDGVLNEYEKLLMNIKPKK
jgi:hypothetical protein